MKNSCFLAAALMILALECSAAENIIRVNAPVAKGSGKVDSQNVFVASIVAGTYSNVGVGYRRQLNGSYSFGTSMTGFGSIPVSTGFTYYDGQYDVVTVVGVEQSSEAIGNAPAKELLDRFTKVDLLGGDGSVVFSYTFRPIFCRSTGYCSKSSAIPKSDFDKWFAKPSLITQVRLSQG